MLLHTSTMNTAPIQQMLKRLWEIIGSVSVRTKVFGIVLGSTFLLSLGFMLQTRIAIQEVLENQSTDMGHSIAHDLAGRSIDLILTNDLYGLYQLLEETQASYGDVSYAFVIDNEGNILSHTFGSGFPPGLLEANPIAKDDHHRTVAIQTNEGLTWDVAVSILDGEIGITRVGISSQSMQDTLAELTLRLGLTVLIVLGISLGAATLLTWIFTRPILELVRATHRVSEGDFSIQVGRWANDEIGDLTEAFNEMTSELGRMAAVRQEREILKKQLLEGVITAQEEERRRISRELHDSTSQSLTSLMVGLRNLSDACSAPEIDQQISLLRDEVSQTLDVVHALAVQLRPVILDDMGLNAAVIRLVAEWEERHGISTDVFVHLGNIRLPDFIETTLYRIIQEALTNIAKHAHANSVSILVEKRGDEVVSIIEDDGQGFDLVHNIDSKHLGLLGMKERAELLDGELTIESFFGQGTSIFISIPLVAKNGNQ